MTIAFMEPPYESATSTTAFRIMSEAQKKGIKVNVFAYEGAVASSMNTQKQHANVQKGCADPKDNDHPTTKAWVESLLKKGNIDWVYCGLCADERGAEGLMVNGVRRGTPADLIKFAENSTNTLIISTR